MDRPVMDALAHTQVASRTTDVEGLLDPELRRALDGDVGKILADTMIPDSGDISSWAQARRDARAALVARRRPSHEDVRAEDHHVRVGSADVRLRSFRRTGFTDANAPLLLWIYGGAFMFGTMDEFDDLYTSLARRCDAVVVGVDYRKAPDDPFPAALDDCYAALQWIASEAGELGIDASRIVIGGGSAGGNLSAGVALLARDRGGPDLAFQMPLYAALDDRLRTSSSTSILDARIVHSKQYAKAWHYYLGNASGAATSPYAAPARANDLSGLPSAYMFVGGLDPMRDENVEYASRLAAGGVSVELHVYPGAFHGFQNLVPTARISQRANDEWLAALRRALARPSQPRREASSGHAVTLSVR